MWLSGSTIWQEMKNTHVRETLEYSSVNISSSPPSLDRSGLLVVGLATKLCSVLSD